MAQTIPPQKILDSHIHLWPGAAANSTSHGWMADPHHPLAREHSISNYLAALASSSSKINLLGIVYVETDRTILPLSGGLPLDPADTASIATYATHPLEELTFLRSLVLDSSNSNDNGNGNGNSPSASGLLRAIVAWMPVDHGPSVLTAYLEIAERTAGPETWSRVKGARYLLQGITDRKKFDDLVQSDGFIDSLKVLGEKGLAFDVGVDERSAGVWQLEGTATALERVRKGGSKVAFVLNHLCKPDLESQLQGEQPKENFKRWKNCMERFAKLDGVYMKLSGAFSELPDQSADALWSAQKGVDLIKPWLDVVVGNFTPKRIMFGSDWPVCNVRGPGDLSWQSWRNLVELALEGYGLSQEEKDRIWFGTATEAYRLDEA